MSDYGRLVAGSAIHFAGPDQGIDFTGPGLVLAPDDIQITTIRKRTGWAGEGTLIAGRLTSGPKKGRYVYFAEDLQPAKGLATGQTYKKGTPLALATGSGKAPGIEIGWAQNAAGQAYGTTTMGKAGGPAPIFGQDFAKYIQGDKSGGGGGSSFFDVAKSVALGGIPIIGGPAALAEGVGSLLGHDPASGAVHAVESVPEKTAAAIVHLLWGAIGQDALRALLYLVFVGGGLALSYAGLNRTLSGGPARAVASIPRGPSAAAAGAAA